MNKFFNNNSGLVVVGTLIIAVCTVVVFYLKPNKNEDNDRIRIKQTVEYTSFLSDSDYYLKTEIFVDDKLAVSDSDFGTYKEIDALKCIRYCEAQQKIINLNKLKNKKCN